MKVVSWNIAGGHIFTGKIADASSYEEENLEYFIDILRERNADIVLLQESHTPIKGGEKSQGTLIAEELGYRFIQNHPYCRSHIKKGQQLSLAILSRNPIKKSYFHTLPNPNLRVTRPNGDIWESFDAGFLVCVIDYKGREITIATGHMIPFHYYERDFMEEEFFPIRESITQFFGNLSKGPAIIGADFNYKDLKKLLPNAFEGSNYYEAFVDVETAIGKGQQDHIVISRQWILQSFSVEILKADHALCMVNVEVE